MVKIYAAFLLLCCSPQLTFSVNLVYDEFLWTKQVWEQAKVENALRHSNPSDLEPKLLEVYPSIKGTSSNSLDGPHERRDGGLEGMSGVIPIDDTKHIKPASEAALCSVCLVLSNLVWQRAGALLIEGLAGLVGPQEVQSPSPGKILELLEDSCKEEAVETLLKAQSILRLGDPIGAMVFFVIRERRKGSPPANSVEKKAARMACQRLVQDSGPAMASVLADNLGVLAKQLSAILEKHDLMQDPGSWVGVSEAGSPGAREARQVASLVKDVLYRVGVLGPTPNKDDDDDYDDDESEVEDPLCMDLHPLCLKWADSGECDANPSYMVGTALSKGHCRKSCGVCVPRKGGASQGNEPAVDTADLRAGHPQLDSELEILLSSLLQAVRSATCAVSKACMTGLTGSGMGPGFMKTSAHGAVEMQPTGWKLGTPFFGQASIKRMSPSELLDMERATGAREGGAPVPEPGTLAAEVDQVLRGELYGKIVSVLGDFFIFEYVFKSHTRQFHEADDGGITEDYILGRFHRESVNVINATSGSAVVLEELDLLPNLLLLLQQKDWPYVKQVYTGGEECVLGGNRRVVRKTEARVACSPDSKVHMLVREPEFCHYIFVIYSPALCGVEKFKPLARAE